MKSAHLHPTSFLAGCGIALTAFALMAQKPTAPATAPYEFRIVDDPEQEDLTKLAGEGWDFAGYLGQGKKGSGNEIGRTHV